MLTMQLFPLFSSMKDGLIIYLNHSANLQRVDLEIALLVLTLFFFLFCFVFLQMQCKEK